MARGMVVVLVILALMGAVVWMTGCPKKTLEGPPAGGPKMMGDKAGKMGPGGKAVVGGAPDMNIPETGMTRPEAPAAAANAEAVVGGAPDMNIPEGGPSRPPAPPAPGSAEGSAPKGPSGPR